ncbi:VOC family protein [Agrobacterium genomosp. 3]|uniref:glyoxalase superfamily protein n=1 Tax=Agrobacterium tomkonis TaxID=1183410 RepID=UPI001CD8632B|nr:VOC family protein [Agrobacterium tomkonis]MCA1874988.1 VOC family protein [Agrobacterium tumefaciens]MCA1890903.1 VOC family protein [Agrobacterium tomkonis]
MNTIADHGIRFGRIAAMLPVRNIEKAHDFYVGVLGFTKTFENGNPVGFMILKQGSAELHLTLQPTHKAAPFNVAHMMVSDVDALHAICKSHGLRIIKGLQDKDYGLRAFVFEDPDGNRIDVGQVI